MYTQCLVCGPFVKEPLPAHYYWPQLWPIRWENNVLSMSWIDHSSLWTGPAAPLVECSSVVQCHIFQCLSEPWNCVLEEVYMVIKILNSERGVVDNVNVWTAVTALQQELSLKPMKSRHTVVSGLSSSKVSACSMLIEEFCGKAGWNDRAVFIETNFG